MLSEAPTTAADTVTARIARYIRGERFDAIDDAAIQRTKRILGYHIGLAFQALKAEERDSLQAIEIAMELSENCGSSTLIGQPRKASLVDAVFANCSMMRGQRLDDVIFPSGIHAGLMTLPVGLAIAERKRVSGADLIAAIVVGYEVLGKFGEFTWAMSVPRRPTMPFGPFGSVAVAARLLGLTQEQTIVALAYGAHTVMGLAENDLGPVTHYYSLVCRNAVTSAFAAKAGAWGSPTVMEGRYGFVDAFLDSGRCTSDRWISQLGRNYVVLESCEKRYPGTALNQVVIELMRRLVEEQNLVPSEVGRIQFAIPVERKQFGGGHAKGPYSGPEAAASSFLFQCALLLAGRTQGSAGYESYADGDLLSLIEKMAVQFLFDKPIRYARIEIHTTDGKIHVAEGDDFKFAPERNGTVLRRDATGVIAPWKIDRAIELLDDLENVEDVSALMECLRSS